MNIIVESIARMNQNGLSHITSACSKIGADMHINIEVTEVTTVPSSSTSIRVF